MTQEGLGMTQEGLRMMPEGLRTTALVRNYEASLPVSSF
jgi:hypothetical protein